MPIDANDQILVQQIQADEGWSATPYQDTLGHWTIGYGTKMSDITVAELVQCWQAENCAKGIRRDQGEIFMRHDLLRVLRWLDAYDWWHNLSDKQARAIANMAYNLGQTKFRQFRKMLYALARGNYFSAKKEALDSRWAKQVGSRATRIADAIWFD